MAERGWGEVLRGRLSEGGRDGDAAIPLACGDPEWPCWPFLYLHAEQALLLFPGQGACLSPEEGDLRPVSEG